MAAIPADVNPDLLVWAREESGYAPEIVAKRLGVKVDRLLAWESGERKPTFRQVEQLGRVLHRAFGVFFLPQRPVLPPLAAEYRRLPGVTPGVESPEFRLAFRVMSRRRELALALNDELGVTVPDFRVSAHVNGAATVGRQLRAALSVTVEEQQAWRNEWEAWRRWRSAVEDAGVLVFQFPKVPLDEARGVALLQFPLPAIGINSKEQSPAARSFTLLHELVHVSLALGHDEDVALRERRSDAQWAEVEAFAEEAASEALIPGDALAPARRSIGAPRDAWDHVNARGLASKFRVTPLAMATRLRRVGALSWDQYREWKSHWDDYLGTLKPRGGGIATPVDKTLGRGGRPFAQLVIEALDTNRITVVDACRYLDLRFDHIEKLRSELRSGGTGNGADDAA